MSVATHTAVTVKSAHICESDQLNLISLIHLGFITNIFVFSPSKLSIKICSFSFFY